MIKEYIDLWQKNKGKMKEWLENTPQSELDYKTLLEKTIELTINDYERDIGENLNVGKMTQIDDGDYQGTLIFVIPKDTYQPNVKDYVVTYVFYGSCSGCDTLESIREYEEDKPTSNQVKEYLILCLHMLERMKSLWDNEEFVSYWES